VTTVAQSVSDKRKLDEAQALFDEVDALRLGAREREVVRAMLTLLSEMRFRTLALRGAGAEPELVDEIELLGDKVQAYVERHRRGRARGSTGFAPGGVNGGLLTSPSTFCALMAQHVRPDRAVSTLSC
jgi:uroporphyrinogen-III synthase